jgi:hypothetical protein
VGCLQVSLNTALDGGYRGSDIRGSIFQRVGNNCSIGVIDAYFPSDLWALAVGSWLMLLPLELQQVHFGLLPYLLLSMSTCMCLLWLKHFFLESVFLLISPLPGAGPSSGCRGNLPNKGARMLAVSYPLRALEACFRTLG